MVLKLVLEETKLKWLRISVRITQLHSHHYKL